MSVTVPFGAVRWFRWGDLRRHDINDDFSVDGRWFRVAWLYYACARFAGVPQEILNGYVCHWSAVPDDAEFAVQFGRCPMCKTPKLHRHKMHVVAMRRL